MRKLSTLFFLFCTIGVYSQVKTLNPVKTTPLPETDLVELEHLIRTVDDDYSKYQALEQKKRDMIDSAWDDEVLSHFYSSSCSWYCGAELNSVESSSSLSDKCDAKGAHDFSILNVWAEGASDYGEGEYLLYSFPGSCPRITAVLVLNGYTKTEKAWKENGRVKKFMMYYNGKPYAVLNLEDTRALQRFDVGVLGFKDSKVPEWNIKFEILEVYPGEKYTDTVITELFFDGIDVH